ncbi:MAG: hypothetical protein U5K33_01220 [Halofilum sp. (in: g-proteobacteria)]|nr:hypothetical protein [Halofilum sp. (in: g-proteobacteria)]
MSGDYVGLIVFLAVMTGTPGPAEHAALVGAGARFGLVPALPFALGVILGMQIVAWPAGLGLLSLAERAPVVFGVLRWSSRRLHRRGPRPASGAVCWRTH